MTESGPKRIRLAKLLAQRGIAARRKAEDLIASGAVTVNGEVAALVTLVDPEGDKIKVSGKPLPAPVAHAYYVLDKPAGYITGRSDPRGRPSVLDFCKGLPVRVEPVGRLDYDTWGALLLTNDGQLAHRLTHPSRNVPKRYAARVTGVPDAATLRKLEAGVDLDDGRTAPARVRGRGEDAAGNARIEITVTEGRNRLVRRMLAAVGHPVLSLRRESFAGITTRGMKRGEVRPLTPSEIRRLRKLAGLASPKPQSAE
jgi:23S rRNA pseudouridine2605 synthase